MYSRTLKPSGLGLLLRRPFRFRNLRDHIHSRQQGDASLGTLPPFFPIWGKAQCFACPERVTLGTVVRFEDKLRDLSLAQARRRSLELS
jgi:hypothetical protein